MKRTLLATMLAAAPLCQGAEVYKWVDEHGVTVYSQSPPPSGTAELSAPPPPPPPPPGAPDAARETLQGELERLDKARETREKAAADEEKRQKEQADRQAACESARKYQADLESRPRVLLQEPDGSTRRLSDDELASMREEARKQVQELCSGD